MKYTIAFGLIGSVWLLLAADPGGGDWPMWGGTPDRNMDRACRAFPPRGT